MLAAASRCQVMLVGSSSKSFIPISGFEVGVSKYKLTVETFFILIQTFDVSALTRAKIRETTRIFYLWSSMSVIHY